MIRRCQWTWVWVPVAMICLFSLGCQTKTGPTGYGPPIPLSELIPNDAAFTYRYFEPATDVGYWQLFSGTCDTCVEERVEIQLGSDQREGLIALLTHAVVRRTARHLNRYKRDASGAVQISPRVSELVARGSNGTLRIYAGMPDELLVVTANGEQLQLKGAQVFDLLYMLHHPSIAATKEATSS